MAVLLPEESITSDAVAEAREILAELGAKPFLERLEMEAGEQASRSKAAVRSGSEVPAG
jgi:hypothetical protein